MPRPRVTHNTFYTHPFAVWIRSKQKYAEEFKKLLAEHGVPMTTGYNWAAGRTLPSGKYLDIWQLFIKETDGDDLVLA